MSIFKVDILLLQIKQPFFILSHGMGSVNGRRKKGRNGFSKKEAIPGKSFRVSLQLVEKPHSCQSKPQILHLWCSLCFLESAAAQGMWALPTPGRGMIPLHPAHF
ncbi:MAG: hypothetical protein E7331_00585 [Clostridiales bacterium]|nr:hypothetical protein [Clostridiales bacterium]